MKDCKKIHPLLPLYNEKELSPSERAKVEKHLALCADARLELEQLVGLIKTLHQLPAPSIPADLHEKIMAKLGLEASPLPKPQGFWGPPAWALSAAALLLFILLNQHTNWHDISRVDSPRKIQNESAPVIDQEPAVESGAKKKSAPVPFLTEKKSAVNSQLARALADRKKSSFPKAPSSSPLAETAASAPSSPAQDLSSSAEKELSMDKNEAPSPAPAQVSKEDSGLPAESMNRSVKSLTYSREESVTTWKGNNGPAAVESQELVTDAQTLQKYWNISHPGQAPPEVDFTKEAVVVLMAEGKPTAGYSIYVSRLEEKTDQLVIHYRVEGPAADAVTAQVLTHPWSLQVIPKPSKPVVFQKDP